MKNTIIWAVAGLLSFTSCENFLDRNPSTSLPSDDAVTSVRDLRFAVNGVYSLMTGTRGTYAGDFIVYADLKGTDLEPLFNVNQISPVSFYTVDKNNSITLDFYRTFYTGLARVNKVMEQAAALEPTSAEMLQYNSLVGELYAVRAMYHFDLTRLYAQLPTVAGVNPDAPYSGIVLSDRVFASSYIGERATLRETYDLIFEDLQHAIERIAEAKNPGHFNYWAVKALEARVNLYAGDYAKALAAADEVIASGGFDLYTTANYLTVWGMEQTSESILEILTTEIYNAQRNSVGYYTHIDGYAEAAASADFVAFLEAQSGDVRSRLLQEEEDQGDVGICIQKYPGRGGNRYLNNPKLFRLSEMYLIASEAALKGATGQLSAAGYLNALRGKRIAGYAEVPTVTLDDVLNERRLELFGEGHHAWDYWRNNQNVLSFTGESVAPQDYMAILPIPQTEIEVSKGMLVQNPEY